MPKGILETTTDDHPLLVRSEFTFSICDANGDNKVSKEELSELSCGTYQRVLYVQFRSWGLSHTPSPRTGAWPK